jgi:hypothetical protein
VNEIDKIKKNLSKRKKSLNNEAKNINKKSGFYRVIMTIMTIYALAMSFVIYAKKDENAIILNSIFKTDINFSTFNSKINDFLDLRILNSKDNEVDSLVVSGEVYYIELGNDYYISEGDIVSGLADGVITYINGKDDRYTVIVEYDNGIRATYYDLIEVNVFSGDRIYSNDIIGTYNEKVKIIFIKDNVKLNYEEILELS